MRAFLVFLFVALVAGCGGSDPNACPEASGVCQPVSACGPDAGHVAPPACPGAPDNLCCLPLAACNGPEPACCAEMATFRPNCSQGQYTCATGSFCPI